MLLKLILINLLPITLASPGFYSFGPQANDKTIDYSLEQSAIALDVPVVFMEKSVNEIFLSHNGIIGLGHRVPDKIVPLKDIANPTIAIYYAPVSSGKIHYRTTSSDRHLLNLLTAEIKQVFADASDFHALQTVIITWVEVENAEKDGQASFQIAIVTDGISTYSIVHYGQLPWSSSMGYYAQTGFVHSVGKVQTNVNSGGPDAKELVNLSNNKFGNSFIFRISGPAIEDPRDEGADDYDYNNYDQEYDNETPEDCPQDPYADNCPNECQTLRDERGCPRCICADRPAPRKPPRVPDLEQIRRDEEEEDSQRAEFHRQEDERHDQKSNHQHHQMQPSAEGRAQNMNNQQIQPSEQERPHHHHHHHHHHQHSEKLTCAQRDEKSCHTHSTCQDYDTGFCCQCESGYFGNGKECLPNGEPQRISGSFEGVINRIAIDRTDLHTFATPNDGNVYTAVSKIPSDIGHPLLLLNTIGSVMGWLFAEGNAPNGFQLTGGIFNRSATLHIGQKYYVTIKQEFSGRDIYDYFKSHLFVSGTLPDIAPGSTVVFPDYEEEYRRERPGLITSQAALDVVVRDGSATETIRMSVSQQIAYHECPHKSTEHDAPTRLQIRRINVVYNPDEGVVRYGSKNQIGANARQHGQSQVVSDEPINIPDDDVCATGRHQCTLPNMRCRAVEPSYRCECEPGYQAAHDSSSPIGWSCADLDECQRGDHNCDPYNGVCMNRHGSFECSCKEGFIGDGRTCTRVQAQEQENVETSAGSCTNHQQCHKWGECVFTADHPTGRCKCRGWYVGDGVNHCGPPERQEPAQPAQPAHQAHHHHHHHHHHQQQTPAVQACGTSICHKDAECMPEPGGGSECVCRAGFTGNGIHCESLVAEKQPQQPAIQQPEITGTVCRSHDQCSEHGSCAYSHSVGYYQCVCREPYVGNGVECHLPGDSSASDDAASTRANDKLLVARGMAIFERSTNPDEPGKQIIVIPHHIPVALDFDCKTDRIVWTDMSGHSIRMSTLNGTEQVSYFAKELSSPEGLAVDWSSRNVYYADSLNDEIGVASIDGKYKKSLITEGLVNPRSVVLDLFSRHVYYSDWHRENPYIGRMNMDGSDNQVFLNDDVHLPNALTILPNRREICWVDAGNHRLSCISLNGSGRRVVFSGLQYPFGLTHDEEAKFYWTDWKDNRIHSVGVYGDGYRSFPISRGGSGKVFGIMKIPSSCVGAATQCSNNNGGCEYLCLPSPSGTKCECPDNVEVKGCA